MSANGINALDPLNWATSTGGAAGSGETTSTLGVDRSDSRVPPDLTRVWAQQINANKNLLLSMSAFFKGGTRLQVLSQSSNPFGVTETGFYADNAATSNPRFSTNGTLSYLANGAVTTKGDLCIFNGTNFVVLPVGANTQVLTADSTQASGIKWAAGGGGGGTQGGATTSPNVPYASGANTLGDSELQFTLATHTFNVGASTVMDFSASSGAFKTSTGAHTFGGSTYNVPAAATIQNTAQGATNTTGMTLKPNVADGASSVGLAINMATAMTSGKMLTLSSNGTLRGSIVHDSFELIIKSETLDLMLRDASNNGFVASNAVGGGYLAVGGANAYGFSSASFKPSTDNASSSGDATHRWSALLGYWHDTKLGAQLTAATTITPTCGLHHVTGATTITNIALTNVPASTNVLITLIADSVITFGSAATSGGIKVAPGTTLASGKAMVFALDNATALWYPVQGA